MSSLELTDGVIRWSPLCLEDVDPHLAGEDAELVRWLSGGISYGLHPAWRGRGIATRAVLLAGAHAAAAGAVQAVLRIEPRNTASIAVAQRVGYVPFRESEEGDGRQFTWYTKSL
jgi:RimJ/RimL family protein N-acetyltransferase